MRNRGDYIKKCGSFHTAKHKLFQEDVALWFSSFRFTIVSTCKLNSN